MRGLIPLLALGVAGCGLHGASGGNDGKTLAQLDVTVPVASHVKADVLFMVDNSPSMDAMQAELLQRFGVLFDGLGITGGSGPIDLHLGVVTSDYGAGAIPDLAGGCDSSPGGQRGHLQALGANAAATGCQAPVGLPFITYSRDASGAIVSNLPSSQDLETTFTCMASVGSMGCGFEHQLESVYAALHDTTTNAGFLRDDAQLVIVFLTNEDDGSAPPTATIFDPDPAMVVTYGSLDTYRQTRFGIACGTPPMLPPYGSSMGLLADCEPAPVGLGGEYDVSRYIDFFTLPSAQGGVKSDPSLVSIIGIEAPSSPVSIIVAQDGTGNGLGDVAQYIPCPSPSDIGNSCVVRVQHSCQSAANPRFFGDPAVRLERVVTSVANHQVVSICGLDGATPDYGPAMDLTAKTMSSRVGGGCVGAALVHPSAPSCTVTIAHAGGASQTIPACTKGSAPCWTVENNVATCPSLTNPETNTAQQARLSITGLLPTDTISASCHAYQAQ